MVAANIGNDVEHVPGAAYPKCLHASPDRIALARTLHDTQRLLRRNSASKHNIQLTKAALFAVRRMPNVRQRAHACQLMLTRDNSLSESYQNVSVKLFLFCEFRKILVDFDGRVIFGKENFLR
ncbi:MAG TPA: hypothetical protein VGW12_04005 [Pyrinomonadaceae bacterium]|nr:hypothetical protein [Pyrinomonadaceae bacterium]